MKCLNWRLGRAFTGHYAISAQKMGWTGIKNGKLLALAVENGFNVFLTADKNLSFQQSITRDDIAVVILQAKGVRFTQTLPLIPKVMELLPTLKPGMVVNAAPE